MIGKYANIIVDISHEKVDRPFQYKIPDHLLGTLEVGMRVLVPFGNGNKEIKGYIMEITDKAEYEVSRLKEIIEKTESAIAVEGEMLKLAWWIKNNYGSTMNAAMKTVLPVKRVMKSNTSRTVSLSVSREEATALYRQFLEKKQVAKARLLLALLERETISYLMISQKLNISPQTIKGLESKNIIRIDSQEVYRNPIKNQPEMEQKKTLTLNQEAIVASFCKDFSKGIQKTYLLHGITGSGKTEIYMDMIEFAIAQNKEAIVLIPEIALTYQTVMRFYKRFGDVVAVMNSKLSEGERFDQSERARRGEVKIMIGPRSALFTPFSNLGLIIIDEEHEGTYKSDTVPKYHAREVAMKLAEDVSASVVLGSATPSLESYYRVKQGEFQLFEIMERIGETQLPKVEIVDLRDELKNGNRSIFSELLREKMKDRLQKKEQIMLFINRRGYAGFVSCRSCGYVAKCPHCDVSMTEHKNGKLVCHYCGYECDHLKKCPQCASNYILGFRVGTEQIEELVKKEFPTARVLRMDADTTRKKDDFEKILSAFANEEADILVGTQMIVKGHDFKKVTLVGIMAADMSLAANDYRASERTFQLITQAAGRAGRGNLQGEVVVQTYQPEHYGIVHAANQDYESFYEEEILYRDLMGYPPVANIMAIMIQSKNENTAKETAIQLSDQIKKASVETKAVVIGPATATIGKINDVFRQMIYVKHREYSTLTNIKDDLECFLEEKKEQYKTVSVYFDFNPMNGY